MKHPLSVAEALKKLIGTPDLCSKRWVWEQYDHIILGNTVQRPGGDAGVVRIEDGPKGLAMTADVTPRYCEADPFEGGKQAVAEAYRNLSAVGALPLAVTDNLNFGNPERPEIMGQFVGCVRGIAAACKALDFPVVSGNVSLYNETNGRAILPTPTIGGVGLLDDFTKSASIAFKNEGDVILLIGETTGLARPVALSARHLRTRGGGAAAGRSRGRRSATATAVRDLIAQGAGQCRRTIFRMAALLIALAEMAMASGLGAKLEASPLPSAHAFWFGEDQARYVVTAKAPDAEQVDGFAARAEYSGAQTRHRVRQGIAIAGEAPVAVADLDRRFESWLPDYMAGSDAA